MGLNCASDLTPRHSKTTWEIFTTEKITQLLQFLKKITAFQLGALAKFTEVHAFVPALKFSKHLLLRSLNRVGSDEKENTINYGLENSGQF